jgi:hypothetical protein
MVHINGPKDVCTQDCLSLDCERRPYGKGNRLEPAATTLDDSAYLTWLVRALEHARTREQTKLVDYLETIADDMVFEMESAARNSP